MSKTFDLIFVDDEAKACDLFVRFCRGKPYRAHTFQDAREALKHFRNHGADLIITDLRMPGMDGIELLAQIRDEDRDVPAIVITAYSTVNAAINALRLGAVDFLKKPFDMEELLALVDRTLNHSRLEHEVRLLRRQLKDERSQQELIGESEAISEVYRVVEKIADVRCNVIIQGESGTGKELLAKAIHNTSASPETPLVVVDCGALSDTLLESELFGHEKGAFTGATHTKRGLLEVADGGTVFLDEIGNISEAMQVKLLRVIQEGQIIRVGGVRPIGIDVRWVVASNRNLETMTRDGSFRLDLFHRLNVVKITMPALRERRRDIPLLIHHFVNYFNDKYQRNVEGFDSNSLKLLLDYPWPGNVRELRNFVERHVVLAEDSQMSVTDLPPTSTDPEALDGDWPTLEEIERRYITKALDHVGGNQRQAASLLGIDKSTLWRKLNQYRRGQVSLDNSD
ncbi:MAG: sigma-54-dependent Fis family transcriptional regulator [Chromatiales bacterium]|nr:sigma-54-dependent Fis family transcriptional regulator [Chromatiales bacterium]